jgi:hypothetical protein
MAYSANYYGVVKPSALEQKGDVYVEIINYNQAYSLSCDAAEHIVIRAPKGTLKADNVKLSPRYAPDSQATFTLDTSNAAYDSVVMRLVSANPAASTLSSDAHVWEAEGSGNWGDAAHWNVLPQDGADDEIVFPSTLSGKVEVNLGGKRKLQKLISKVDGELLLAGGNIDAGNGLKEVPVVAVEHGVLSLPAVSSETHLEVQSAAGSTQIWNEAVSAVDGVSINSAMNGGTVKLAGVQNGGSFNITSGRVEGSPESFGDGTWTVENSTIGFTSSGDVTATLKVPMSSKSIIDVKGEVRLFNPLENELYATVFKRGAGTLVLVGGGSFALGGANKVNDNVDAPWTFPENGDAPAGVEFSSLDVVAGKIVFGTNPLQEVILGGRLTIGTAMADFDENGDVLDSEMEILGGVVKVGTAGASDFNMGRNAGLYRKHKGLDARKRSLTFTQRGGEFYCGSFYLTHDGPGYYNGTTTFNLYDGLFKSSGAYVYLNNAITKADYDDQGVSRTEINIYGGVFTNTVYDANAVGGLKTYPIASGNLDLNLYGGDFAWTSPLYAWSGNTTKIKFNFAGGRLITQYIRRNNHSNGPFVLYWNGGVLHPTFDNVSLCGQTNGLGTAGYAYTGNIVSTNGACFEVAAGRTFIIDQKFTHDEELGELKDGGVAMLGGGTLVLETANEFTGPVRALCGVVRSDVSGAIPNGAALELSGGEIALNGFPVTVGDIYGSGGVVGGAEMVVGGRIYGTGEIGSRLIIAANSIFDSMASFAPRYSYDEESKTYNSDVLVLDASASGDLTIDLGRDEENSLPKGFRVKVAELKDAQVTAPRMRVVNYGNTRRLVAQTTRVVRDDGVVEIYAEVMSRKFAIILR